METFTATQVCKMTGLPYPVVHSWAATGFLKPSVEDSAGRGSSRRYSLADVLAMVVVAALRHRNLHEHLRGIVTELQSIRHPSDETCANRLLLIDPTGVVTAVIDEKLTRTVGKAGGIVTVVSLGHVLDRVVVKKTEEILMGLDFGESQKSRKSTGKKPARLKVPSERKSAKAQR